MKGRIRYAFGLLLESLLLAPLFLQDVNPGRAVPRLESGTWHVELQSPGGPLPFDLLVQPDEEGKQKVSIENGTESIAVDHWRLEGGTVLIEFPHYQSTITAYLSKDGKSFSGQWKKVSATSKPTMMKLVGRRGVEPRFAFQEDDGVEVEGAVPEDLTGRNV